MIKYDILNTKNINRKDKTCAILFELLCVIFLMFCFNYLKNITIQFLIFPILIVLTLIIHELLHIICFKIFNKNAKIKVINQNFKTIYIYQCNKDILYTKHQTVIILLTPIICISVLSLVALLFINENSVWFFMIYLNAIINTMGSLTDVILSFKLMNNYKDLSIKIQYDLTESGVEMIIYKEE